MRIVLQRRSAAVRLDGLAKRHAHEVLVELPHVEDEAASLQVADPLLKRVTGQNEISQV